MPREMSNERCELEFDDKLGSPDAHGKRTLTLYYRLPETDERVGYANEMFVRKGNKIENRNWETRLKYGLKILTGFKEGDFTIDKKPYSWDPQSPIYNAGWKAIIKKYGSDLVSLLSMQVFEVSAMPKQPETDKEDLPKEEDGESEGEIPAAGSEGKDKSPL
jgi:hypothetical protein